MGKEPGDRNMKIRYRCSLCRQERRPCGNDPDARHHLTSMNLRQLHICESVCLTGITTLWQNPTVEWTLSLWGHVAGVCELRLVCVCVCVYVK